MRVIGMVLVILGIVALAYGGIQYNQRKTLFQVGDLKATATEHKQIPISPAVGVVALLLGIGVMVAGARRDSKA
jgi:hypothetical protein